MRNVLPDQCQDDLEVLQSPHRILCTSTTRDIPAETERQKAYKIEILTLHYHCNVFVAVLVSWASTSVDFSAMASWL